MNIFNEDQVFKPPSKFYKFVFEYHKQKFKNNIKIFEGKILNLLASVEKFKNSDRGVNIFYKFLTGLYNWLDLNCFLLMRVLIVKDIEVKNNKIKLKTQK